MLLLWEASEQGNLEKNALVKGHVALVYHLSVWVHSCHTDWKTLIHGLVFWQVCLSICTCQEGGQGGTSNRRLHGEVLDHHTLDSSTPTIPVSHMCVCATCLTCARCSLEAVDVLCSADLKCGHLFFMCHYYLLSLVQHISVMIVLLNKVHHSSRSV